MRTDCGYLLVSPVPDHHSSEQDNKSTVSTMPELLPQSGGTGYIFPWWWWRNTGSPLNITNSIPEGCHLTTSLLLNSLTQPNVRFMHGKFCSVQQYIWNKYVSDNKSIVFTQKQGVFMPTPVTSHTKIKTVTQVVPKWKVIPTRTEEWISNFITIDVMMQNNEANTKQDKFKQLFYA